MSLASTHSAEHTYWHTDEALQPGALNQRMPCASHQAVSIWSYPMVAEAMTLTREPSSSSRVQGVRVRVTRASAPATSAREIAAPGRYTTSVQGSNTPLRKGILSSHTIFGIIMAMVLCEFKSKLPNFDYICVYYVL